MLIDRHHRVADYLRIAVTDRCNLRCTYCMPEQGIQYVPREEVLSWEELLRISRIFADLGISKVRITGGEPLLRRDIMFFIQGLAEISGINKINLTTNGTVTEKYLDDLWKYGVRTINLSLDTLDKAKFKKITRRDEFDTVIRCFGRMIKMGFRVKINCVVMSGVNDDEIESFVRLTENLPVSVRFIEEMPFNGEGKEEGHLEWSYIKILQHIKDKFEAVEKLEDPQNSTAYNYTVKDYKGSFGVIAAYSRTFCGSCNRIRLTPQGSIKTCLYDSGIFNIKQLLRAGATDQELAFAIQEAVSGKAKDGFQAELLRSNGKPVSESMSTIGG
ncbi:GTP 3',8-cyclase MoaA [Portibacter marinus]|uniref:GTP 3',8-cyclase MoaA n=1 Tax=Portibacter marinus TaxID=2898660 RepID=UPI001F3D85F8|nr:GTP 3',8-cyclase MoaA [Portibacter marinus]